MVSSWPLSIPISQKLSSICNSSHLMINVNSSPSYMNAGKLPGHPGTPGSATKSPQLSKERNIPPFLHPSKGLFSYAQKIPQKNP
jgi:hypothetical protein